MQTTTIHHIVADSGTSKTDWVLVRPNGEPKTLYTHGMNPYVQTEEELNAVVQEELLPQMNGTKVGHLWFYGAGCSTDANRTMVRAALAKAFPEALINVEHDLSGAARALCHNTAGVACIMGTGSNSCVYDGKDIVAHNPSLGYVLGDEGGGVFLGKMLLKDFMYNEMPQELKKAFFEEYGLDRETILAHIYKKPGANRWMARFAKFYDKHQHHPYIARRLEYSFNEFIVHHINKYPEHKHLPVHALGSVVHAFRKFWQRALQQHGWQMGKVVKKPMPLLAQYHFPNLTTEQK